MRSWTGLWNFHDCCISEWGKLKICLFILVGSVDQRMLSSHLHCLSHIHRGLWIGENKGAWRKASTVLGGWHLLSLCAPMALQCHPLPHCRFVSTACFLGFRALLIGWRRSRSPEGKTQFSRFDLSVNLSAETRFRHEKLGVTLSVTLFVNP